MAETVNTGRSISDVLLLGATSQVGVFALGRLLQEGFGVKALSRRVSGSDSASQSDSAPGKLEWLNPGQLRASGETASDSAARGHLMEVEAVFSCGPISLADQWLKQCPRVRRVVCLSTSSLYTKLNSAEPRERRLMAKIKRSEETLKSQCRERGIGLLVLRPTLIYGCGLDNNVSAIARLVRRFRCFPVAGRASGLRQPVHADDLAAVGLSALKSESLISMESPIGGGSVLSYRDMAARVFQAFGLKPRLISIQPSLLAVLAATASWLPGSDGLNAQFVHRQNLDQVFDDTVLRQSLPFTTRPFAPEASDFQIPPELKRLQPAPSSGL